MADEPRYTVKATQTSFAILEAVREWDGAGVTELADHLDISKSAVHNHLQTLAHLGYLTQTGDTYRVGLRCLQLGVHARRRVDLFESARPEIEKLAVATGERASLLVEEDGEGVYLYSTSGGRTSPIESPEGEVVALHAVAAGKAILAHMPPDRVDAVLGETDRTTTDRRAVREDLQTIRERGLAFDRGERDANRRGVAAPIRDPSGNSLGAVEIAGPESRTTGKRLEEDFTGLVLSTASAIETAHNAD